MTNQEFLQYLNGEFGVLSRGLVLDRTAEEMADQAATNQKSGLSGFETVNKSNYSPLWGLRTVSHPDLRQFNSWYHDGRKRFPDDLELTPEIVRMWYICDGWLAVDSRSSDNPRIMFKASNESDRADYLVELFTEIGFKAGFSRNSVQISAYDTNGLLAWMGDSPPGFEYKWQLEPT